MSIVFRSPRVQSVLAAALAFLVYLFTLAPTVFALDSAELTLAAMSLGLVHAPGYPVYLLVGHLFTYLPVADAGYRLNLLSAVANASNVALVILLVQRLTRRTLPGLVAGLSYAFCFYSWSLSVVAEVYTLQGLFLAGNLLACLQWRDSGKRRWLLTAIALTGLAVANNPGTGLWWPGLLLLAWMTPHRKRLTAGDYWKMGTAFLLATMPVLYLPLRSAARPAFVQVGHFDATGEFHAVDLTQFGNLLWYLSGRQFESFIFGYSLMEYGEQAVQFLYWLWAAFLGIGLPLGLGGAWSLWQRNRTVAAALLLIALPHALFFIGYRAIDKETMFLPVFLVWAVLLGIGVARILRSLPRQFHAFTLLLPAALLYVNLSYVDVSDFRMPYERAKARLLDAEVGALYLATWGDAELMRYHQIVHGLRQDVDVVNLFFIAPDDLTALVQRQLDNEGSAYSTLEFSLPARRLRFDEAASGYRILPRRKEP